MRDHIFHSKCIEHTAVLKIKIFNKKTYIDITTCIIKLMKSSVFTSQKKEGAATLLSYFK